MSAPPGAPVSLQGGHDLPAHIVGASTRDAPPPRHRRTRLWVGLTAGLLAVAAVAVVQTSANLGYDDAAAAFQSVRDRAQASISSLQQSTAELTATTEVANQLLQNDTGVLSDPTARESLGTAVAQAGDLASSATESTAVALPDADPKPAVFWELFGETAELQEKADRLAELVQEVDAEAPALADADASIDEAGVAYLGTAATAASAFETAHISARNDDVIALRTAASAVAATTTLDDTSVASFLSLQDAAAQVVASEQAELAEKAGPLANARLEVEAFARSLAPGVLLEFDWNPIVNNAGTNGSMGGLTTWWWDEPDRALIELSDSVAQQWPAERSRALVAHEVGHAISVKCEDMYDSSTQDSIEKWATAWAISMGFTDDANGVWAYGYPPQSYIDAAYGCR